MSATDYQAVEQEAQRSLSGLLNPRSAMFPSHPTQGVTMMNYLAPTSTTSTSYSTQAEAEREARAALWGEVPFHQREMLRSEPGTYSIVVTADVNGWPVAFLFDNYGRRADKPRVLR